MITVMNLLKQMLNMLLLGSGLWALWNALQVHQRNINAASVKRAIRHQMRYKYLLAFAAVVYLAAYPILNAVFGTGLLNLGIYLPMLTVEPLLTYRFGRVQETVRKAVSKGLRITVGYALLLVLLGCIREWLAAGTVFGVAVSRPVLPMAGMPAGGFIVLGVLCAVWRALAAKRRAYLTKEAGNLVDVHSQKEADREG